MYQNVTDSWWIGTPNWQQRSLYSPLESLDEIGSFICTAIRPEDRLKMQPWHSCYKPVTKLRWKFPVEFVRTCSTGLLRPDVNMLWRSLECSFLTRDLWHWVCLRDVNGAEGGTLPPADSIVYHKSWAWLWNFTYQHWWSLAILRSFEDESVVDFLVCRCWWICVCWDTVSRCILFFPSSVMVVWWKYLYSA